MKVIGITGGVGSGKSLILNYIKDHYNCEIIMADDLAKDLCKKGELCYKPLVKLLGKDVLGTDEEIDRSVMAQKIFSDDSLRTGVNNIIHPGVKKFILKRIAYLRRKKTKDFLFIEAALLIEDGYKDIVDELWYIYTDKAVRRERLKKSRGYSDEKIDSIMASQLSEEEFRLNSDFEIDNSGD
ncbi:MAG: dephospho-CoA kinase, partial [Lachnospiraceae bacterium]|nr:dephospho-CoA kinase [Lachnospiraceae bacterium]